MNFFDRKKEEFTYIMHDPTNDSSLSNSGINSIVCDKKGNLWVATNSGGLNHYSPSNNKSIRFVHNPDDGQSLINNSVNYLIVDKHQNLWIATNSGIDFLADGENKFQHLYKGGVDLLYQDTKGQIFAGVTGDGIYIFNTATNRFEKYFPEFINSSIRSILIDTENNLWAGGNKGLTFVNTSDSTSYNYSKKNGLPTNLIMGILEDQDKNLWVSTSSGLLKCDSIVAHPGSLVFRTFSLSDGIQSNQFYPYSFMKSSSNDMFFGGINGFNMFNPKLIKDNKTPPLLAFTGLKIFNKMVQVGQEIEGKVVLSQPLAETQSINLSHKHRVVTFDFVALHYSDPKHNKYRYKLSPLEKDWNYTTAGRSDATYTNLHGGEYTFMVEAANSDGYWSGSQLSLSVNVFPPFWQTRWFIVLSILFLVVAIVSYYLFRISTLKKYSTVLEKEVQARTVELQKSKTQIEDDYQRFILLSEFGNKITSTLNQKDIISMIFEYVNVLVHVDYLGVGMVNAKTGYIEYPSLMSDKRHFNSFEIPLDEEYNCAVKCLNNQSPVLSDNFENDYPKFIVKVKHLIGFMPGSLMCLPLTVENKKIGVLTIFNERKAAFNERHTTILQTLSYYVSIALSNSNTYEVLSNQTKILSEMNSELVNRQEYIEKQRLELIKQKESLQELNLMKDKFFSIIAHDLKSPFQALLGFAELLKSDFNILDDERKFEYTNYIAQSANNIFNLLTNLLTWSRAQTSKDTFEPKNIPLSDTIDKVLSLLKNNYQNKSIIVKNLVPPSLYIFADKNMVETIFRNLVSNAIKFTQVKGNVIIDASLQGPMCQISINDSGIGMTEDDVKNLFAIDKTISRAGTSGESGTGLGLVICKEFIEKNGGKIWVESNLGYGSTFYFTLKIPAPIES